MRDVHIDISITICFCNWPTSGMYSYYKIHSLAIWKVES